ncbi:hypothetical protein AAC387_Pa10g0479 [Persea americana]
MTRSWGKRKGRVGLVRQERVRLEDRQFWEGRKKRIGPLAYRLSVFDTPVGKWECLPIYPDGLPLFYQLVGLQGKPVVMGGWDPSSWDLVRHVFVYDFMKREWRQGRDMPTAQSFFMTGVVDDRWVVVVGGHNDNKNALKTTSSSGW